MWIAAMIVLPILGYLFIGASYARFQSVACYERARYHTAYYRKEYGPISQSGYNTAIGLRIAFWPAMMAVDLARGPSVRYVAEIRRLEQERDRWSDGRCVTNDAEERRLMIASYDEQLTELQYKNRRGI